MPWRKRYLKYGLMLILIFNLALGETRFRSDPKFDQNMLSPISSPDSNSPVRLFVKDWIAQWDPLYNTWFYFNINTGQYLSELQR